MPLSRHILAVDDNPDVLDVLLRILQQLGFPASSTISAREAAHLPDDTLDVVVMLITDIDMPEMDGYTLADTLRVRRPSLPVLLMSGSNSTASRPVRGDGPMSFLPKPFTAKEIDTAIGGLLERANAQPSLSYANNLDGGRITG